MPILFDSSLYIESLRRGGGASLLLQRWARESPLWLSSVVLEELYAGSPPAGQAAVEKLERDFERAKRILVPSVSDWAAAGKVLAKIGRKYGYEQIGKTRLTNDALIAMSAARAGITIYTANPRDFARLAEFRAFSWQTRDLPSS
jgi:predicted nucleic acid-binding protein